MLAVGLVPNIVTAIITVTVTVTGLHSSTTFSEESCSVDLSEKIGFQLRSELFVTVCGERRSGGSAFQTTGAAMEKLRWPMDEYYYNAVYSLPYCQLSVITML